MSKQGPSNRPIRALKAGGPPALITAGIAIASTGIAGQGLEKETRPIATAVASVIGTDPQFGPLLLLGIAVLILPVAVVMPGLFEDHPSH